MEHFFIHVVKYLENKITSNELWLLQSGLYTLECNIS